jgi:hypothetical protein
MISKRLVAVLCSALALSAVSGYAQSFPPQGNDNTNSLASFKIQIMPRFVNLFSHPNPPNPPIVCPGFDPTTNILSGPQMFDQQTVIGRSMSIPGGDGSSADLGGVPVGQPFQSIQVSNVSESMLIPPPGFPCSGVSGCTSGPGTHEVHTEVESLHLMGSGAAVRAGQWYNSSSGPSWPPAKISPGEVESQSGPGGTLDFPASSFFDVFAQVDMPACPAFTNAFPGGTLYNLMPLVVKNNQVNSFPPTVVYLHDASSIVPILFLNDKPGFWQKDDILGYFLLVGHGVGVSPSDFNTFMTGQSNASCPIGPPPPSGAAAVQPQSSPTVASGKGARPTPEATNKSASGGGNRSIPGGGNR